jgi:hypothetical protein
MKGDDALALLGYPHHTDMPVQQHVERRALRQSLLEPQHPRHLAWRDNVNLIEDLSPVDRCSASRNGGICVNNRQIPKELPTCRAGR